MGGANGDLEGYRKHLAPEPGCNKYNCAKFKKLQGSPLLPALTAGSFFQKRKAKLQDAYRPMPRAEAACIPFTKRSKRRINGDQEGY
eukprot:1144698-Pelagomonas_calceolata.AAC.1